MFIALTPPLRRRRCRIFVIYSYPVSLRISRLGQKIIKQRMFLLLSFRATLATLRLRDVHAFLLRQTFPILAGFERSWNLGTSRHSASYRLNMKGFLRKMRASNHIGNLPRSLTFRWAYTWGLDRRAQ